MGQSMANCYIIATSFVFRSLIRILMVNHEDTLTH